MTAVRLTLAYMGVLGVFAIGITAYVAYETAELIQKQARDRVEDETKELAGIYRRGNLSSLVRAVERRARSPGANLYLITRPDGTAVGGNVGKIDPAIIERTIGDPGGWTREPFEYDRFGAKGMERSEALARVVTLLPSRLRLLIGRDVGEQKRFRSIVRRTLLLAGASILVFGLFAWLLVGRRALSRIDAVANSSRRIMAGDLSQRIPLSGTGDEFDRLSENLNGLIARIERLDAGMKQVSDNIAHDLRTPLARIRTRAEEAKHSGDKGEALASIIAEADRLIETFNALLMISRTEAGAQAATFSVVDLSQVAQDVFELYEPAAEDAGVEFERVIDPGVSVRGNRELLAQATANLIDNALKYSGARTIRIEVAREGREARLTVIDNGNGVPENEREKVTERFYRRDEARSGPGSGLGLALVKAIADLHEGSLKLDDAAPGLAASVRVPA